MFFEFDGKNLTVTGKNLSVKTSNGATVISDEAPATGGAPATTGAKRGRKPKTTQPAQPATEFNPGLLES